VRASGDQHAARRCELHYSVGRDAEFGPDRTRAPLALSVAAFRARHSTWAARPRSCWSGGKASHLSHRGALGAKPERLLGFRRLRCDFRFRCLGKKPSPSQSAVSAAGVFADRERSKGRASSSVISNRPGGTW
jgi:hypothetical protein